MGFPIKFIDLLVCQKTGESLGIKYVQTGDDSFIIDGTLESVSGFEYKIMNGIVYMLDDQSLYGEAKQEIVSRDKEADTYDKRLSSRYDKEIPSTINKLRPWVGQKVLDLGCGTGRVSGELEGSELLGVDMSASSLRIFQKKKTNLKYLGLVCADATSFRVKSSSFDRVLSSQVYEHIPTKARRISFLRLVKDSIHPKGFFVATVYHHDIRRRLLREPKEGYHPSGIFYHYFDSKEIESEFGEIFNSVSVRPIDITLPFESSLKLSYSVGGKLSRLCERFLIVHQFGHLLLIEARIL